MYMGYLQYRYVISTTSTLIYCKLLFYDSWVINCFERGNNNAFVDIRYRTISRAIAVAYARGGRVWGATPPPIDDIKKTLFLKRSVFFHAEFAEIAVMFFFAIQLAY